jgi:hypothetical protein
VRRALVLLATLAACAAPPSPPPPPRPSPLDDVPLRAGVSGDVAVTDLDLADVMDVIGRQANVNILVDPTIHERVTVSLRDIPWREAVDVIARMTRCEVEARPGGILVLTRPVRITVWDAAGNDVRELVELAAAYAGRQISLPRELRGVVTSFDDVRDVFWLDLIERALADAGDYWIDEYGDLLVVRSAVPTMVGEYVGHDARVLTLELASGKVEHLLLPSPAGAGALAERRARLMGALRVARAGDPIAVRVTAESDGWRVSELVGGD